MQEEQHNPNAGEGASHYDSSASRSSTSGISDSAGVADGLSEVAALDVKGDDGVLQNQRIEGSRESAGDGFEIGC